MSLSLPAPRRLLAPLGLATTAAALVVGVLPGAALDEKTPYEVMDEIPYVQTVAIGPSGEVWGRGEGAMGRLNPTTGAVDPECDLNETDFPNLTDTYLFEIDPEGRLWLPWTEDGTDVPGGLRVLRVDPVTCDTDDFELTGAEHGAADIEALPNGTVWVSTFNTLVLLDADTGAVLDTIDGSFPYFDSMVVTGGLIFGARHSDGSLWVVDPSDDSATELFPEAATRLVDLVVGPDGRVWFAGEGAPDTIFVASVAATGEGISGFEVEGAAGNVGDLVFGPDGNLWLTNNTPSQLIVVDPDAMALLRIVDFVDLQLIPIQVAADATSVWAAAYNQESAALVRVGAVDPADPIDPTDPTPTAPSAQPVGGRPSFTG